MAAGIFLHSLKYLAGSRGEEKRKEDAWYEKRLNDEAAARVDARFATKNWKDEYEVKKNYRAPTPPKYPLEEDRSKRKSERSRYPRRLEDEREMDDRRSDVDMSTSGWSYTCRSGSGRSNTRDVPSERSYAGMSSSARSYPRRSYAERANVGLSEGRRSTSTRDTRDESRYIDDRWTSTHRDYRQDRT